MIDAARFVPQSRQRLFVVGRQNVAQEITNLHIQISAESELRPPALASFISRNPEIEWAIRSLPPPPKRRKSLEELLEPESATEWWGTERAEYLLNQMSLRHRKIADKMIAGKNWSYGTVFRRVRNSRSMAELRVDGTAGCLRTPRGGSGRQILFKAGKGKYQVRLLTPRECARLMGAGNYRIDETTTLNQALFGFGDAVCVPVIRWIAKNYLNPLVEELGQHSQNTNGKKLSAVA
jgi:DNA (cytosine-5)-methyltransferase 1